MARPNALDMRNSAMAVPGSVPGENSMGSNDFVSVIPMCSPAVDVGVPDYVEIGDLSDSKADGKFASQKAHKPIKKDKVGLSGPQGSMDRSENAKEFRVPASETDPDGSFDAFSHCISSEHDLPSQDDSALNSWKSWGSDALGSPSTCPAPFLDPSPLLGQPSKVRRFCNSNTTVLRKIIEGFDRDKCGRVTKDSYDLKIRESLRFRKCVLQLEHVRSKVSSDDGNTYESEEQRCLALWDFIDKDRSNSVAYEDLCAFFGVVADPSLSTTCPEEGSFGNSSAGSWSDYSNEMRELQEAKRAAIKRLSAAHSICNVARSHQRAESKKTGQGVLSRFAHANFLRRVFRAKQSKVTKFAVDADTDYHEF